MRRAMDSASGSSKSTAADSRSTAASQRPSGATAIDVKFPPVTISWHHPRRVGIEKGDRSSVAVRRPHPVALPIPDHHRSRGVDPRSFGDGGRHVLERRTRRRRRLARVASAEQNHRRAASLGPSARKGRVLTPCIGLTILAGQLQPQLSAAPNAFPLSRPSPLPASLRGAACLLIQGERYPGLGRCERRRCHARGGHDDTSPRFRSPPRR